jgi:hypothetical protein
VSAPAIQISAPRVPGAAPTVRSTHATVAEARAAARDDFGATCGGRIVSAPGIDQRAWWERGDDARRADVRAGNVLEWTDRLTELGDGGDTGRRPGEHMRDGGMPRRLESEEIRSSLAAHFDTDLAALSDAGREAALEAAVHGYVEGRPGGYGQPSWLDAHAGGEK